MNTATHYRKSPVAVPQDFVARGRDLSSRFHLVAAVRPYTFPRGTPIMVHQRRFRFGLFAESVRSRETLLDTARRAEDCGFATFLIRDHFIDEPFGHQLAPLTALAAVACATTQLRVGSLV